MSKSITSQLRGYEVETLEVTGNPVDFLKSLTKSHKPGEDGAVYMVAKLRKSVQLDPARRIIDRDSDGMVLDGTKDERPAQPHEMYEKDGGTIKQAGVKADKPYGGWEPAWQEKPDPAVFIAARDKILERDPSLKPFLSPVKPEDLANHKIFLSADGKVGAAVSPEGDIQNVFNAGGPRGAGTEAMIAAVKAGGKTLDCYDDTLPTLYGNFGFEETNRMKFNREYAPEGWDYDKYKEPDVVFMARTKGLSEEEMRESASRKRSEQEKPTKSEQYTDDWDGAKSESGRAADAAATQGGGAGGAPDQRGDSPTEDPRGTLTRIASEKTAGYKPPPVGIDIDLDTDGDGITDYSRVGVPGYRIPKKIPRVANLTPIEQAVEDTFAEQYEKDPHATAAAYRKAIEAGEIGDGPTIYNTDDAKMLSSDYSMSLENRSVYNMSVHQTANAIAKLAFVSKLNDIAKLPEGERKVLITAGGVAAGKGHALKANEDVAKMKDTAAAIWDSAGDQYSTELPWVHKELEKRGIEGTYIFVHSNPSKTYWNEQGWGAVDRAKKSGRMVDHIVHAESYHYGAKNFMAFQKKAQGSKAKFVVIDNFNGKPKVIDSVPMDQVPSPEAVIKSNEEVLLKSGAPPHIMRGATIGKRIWKKGATESVN